MTDEGTALLDEVLTGYLRAVDEGHAPDRADLLAQHPELAPDLERFFASQAAFARLAEPVRQFCQATPVEGADATSEGPPVGLGVFGDYELVRLIARGGMGAVFEARQRSVPRRVALKVIRAGAAATADDVRRFRNEVETVARLDHPNVVPVYDAGEHDGAVYFSMKLYEAGSLADRLGGFAADPRGTARLVAELARAVHHAHQRGVLHRDLKPSNVLLDEAGRPAVADFGLARRLDADGDLSRSGSVVGTPNYMAPELTAGRHGVATVAADVYGLGAVLYALLTGRPPFRGETVLETLEQVKGREPEPPRRLNPRVDRDLETVCLKCLHKEPGSRYASAAELADDLERWLAGQPVRARRAGRWERARKWVRRNPALAALLAVVALSVTAAVAGLVWHNERLWAEKEQTARERDEARKSRRIARRAVNDMYSRFGEEWLADAPHMTDVQREFLTKALEFYEEVVRDPGAEPEDRLELGRALVRIAPLRGQDQQTETCFRESVRVLEELVGEYPAGPEYRLELARSSNRLGRFLVNRDRFLDSEVALRRARTEAEGLHRSKPEHPEYRVVFASVLDNQREWLQRTGRLAAARDVGQQARKLARWLSDHQPAVARHRELLAKTTLNLGNVLLEMNLPGEAAECIRDAVAVIESLALGSQHRTAIRSLHASALENLGALQLDAGEVEEAEKTMARSVEVRRKLREEFPIRFSTYGNALASGYALHGGILARLERFREAETALGAALTLQEKVVEVTGIGRRSEELAVFTGSHAWLRLRLPQSAAATEEIVPLLRRAREMAPAGERYRLTLVGLAYYRLGKWDEAVTTLQQAAEVPEQPCRWTTDDPLIRRTAEEQEDAAETVNAYCLAMVVHRLGRASEALDWYRQALVREQNRPARPTFGFVDVETIRAEVEAVLEAREPATLREKR